jgi:hypothetical protein
MRRAAHRAQPEPVDRARGALLGLGLLVACAAPEPPSRRLRDCPALEAAELSPQQDATIEGQKVILAPLRAGLGTALLPAADRSTGSSYLPSIEDWSSFELQFRFKVSPPTMPTSPPALVPNARGLSIVAFDSERTEWPLATGSGAAHLGLQPDDTIDRAAEQGRHPIQGWAVELDFVPDYPAGTEVEPDYAHAALSIDGALDAPLAVSDWRSFPLAAREGWVSVAADRGALEVLLRAGPGPDGELLTLLAVEDGLPKDIFGWVGFVGSLPEGPQQIELSDVALCMGPPNERQGAR